MEEKKYKFELSFFDLNTVIKGCKELPYKESSSLIERLIKDYNEQVKELEKEARAQKK